MTLWVCLGTPSVQEKGQEVGGVEAWKECSDFSEQECALCLELAILKILSLHSGISPAVFKSEGGLGTLVRCESHWALKF